MATLAPADGESKDHGTNPDNSLLMGYHVPGLFLVRGLGRGVAAMAAVVLSPVLALAGGGYAGDRASDASRFATNFSLTYGAPADSHSAGDTTFDGSDDERKGDQDDGAGAGSGAATPAVPAFVSRSFREAVAMANQASRPLFVYFHSPLHPDAEAFCQDTLCNPQLAQYLNSTFVLWGGAIDTIDGYDAMTACQVTSFPHVAVYVPGRSQNQYQKLWSLEGAAGADEVLSKLQAVMAVGREHVERVAAQRVAQQADRLLRQEQEQAFREAEARDRAKEQEKERELERKEAELERKALDEAKELSVKLAKEADIERARERLTAEPAPGDTCTRIRFTLPSGTRIERRFLPQDTVQMVRDYVLVTLVDMGEAGDDISGDDFELASTFPRRVYGADSDTVASTLKDAGLAPQAVLFVTL